MAAGLSKQMENAFITNVADGETIVETSKDNTVITVSSTKMMLDASRVSRNQVNFNNSVTEEDSNSESDEEQKERMKNEQR